MVDRVVVLPHKQLRGWRGEDLREPGAPGLFPVVELDEALRRVYDTDAHFMPYYVVRKDGSVPPRVPRINKEGLGTLQADGHRLLFGCVVLDIDDPDSHARSREGAPVEARAEWRTDQDDLYGELPAELLGGMARYDTRGGYRLLWKLPEPLEPEAYLELVAGLRRELYQRGIVADVLKDWGRLYRLPFVTRDGTRQDFDADLGALGELSWELPARSDGPFSGIGAVQVRELAKAPGKITENRNDTLTRLAGGFRRRGLPYESVLGMLQVVNANQCEPPMGDEEVESIARSVCRYDPEVPLVEPETGDGNGARALGPRFTLGDEVEIAGVCAEDLEGEEPLVYDRSRLWKYAPDLGVWDELVVDRVARQIHTYSGEGVMRGLDRQGNPKIAPLKVSARLCDGVRSVLQAQKTRAGWFDDADEGLVFRDCFVQVDADGVKTEPFSPKHRQRSYLPFPFLPAAEPTRFLAMLRSCWRDDDDCESKIRILREWVGAALTGRAPRYAKALILCGGGANGKSTVQEIVTALFPRGTVTAIPPQEMDQEYRRAKLAAARLNCVAELPEADILVSEAVKAMIGGDLMTGRFIREAVFEFQPRAAHLFSANALPGVRDMTAGFWRRWLVLTFDREFRESEQDRTLAATIIRDELPAIASWVVEGAAELAARSYYDVPASSDVALAEWRHQADQIASFLEARCVLGTDTWVGAAELYNNYSQWTVANGHRRMSRVNFGKRLKILGVHKGRKSAGIEYEVELRPALQVVV